MTIDRRRFAALAAAVLPLSAPRLLRAAPGKSADWAARLQRIEQASGGRLGVCIVDAGDGSETAWRPDERFPMCSTFKLLASALVLRRVDQGLESLDRVVRFGRRDLVGHSPVTAAHAAAGRMTLGALCEATMTTSDNAAANLILASYGGPPALTAALRALGDPVTRLDRIEPALNDWRPGDPRDTTSPRAMLRTMQRLALGDALRPASRERLQRWMVANTTGTTRLRAGLPAGWRVGDKTGSNGADTLNDIGIVWPPGRAPLLVTAYLTGATVDAEAQARALAEVGALVAAVAQR